FVLEVSSFQLDGIESFRPDIALLLNITPDHLDRYGYSMEAYAAAKFRIAENQQPEDVFIYCTDDPWTLKQWPEPAPNARKEGFGTGKVANGWVDNGRLHLSTGLQMPWLEVPLMGRHNQRNVLAALLAGQAAGLTEGEMKAGLRSFAPIEHRLEPIGSLDAVQFINDSKATNVDAVYYALEAMDKPVIWMAGGVDKGNDYQVLQDLVAEKVKGIVVLGSGYAELDQAFSVPMIQTGGMKEAVQAAREWAEAGDAVLLSPACASFDLFRNYIDRGDQFRAEVQRLISEQETHKT
ncbi:MAG: UDP-N-acetylmuramoyl-L-alanine--D-glutamate ligase, partial [Bacteroidota bacterium]